MLTVFLRKGRALTKGQMQARLNDNVEEYNAP